MIQGCPIQSVMMRIGSGGLRRRICAGDDRFVAPSSRAMVRLSVVAGREFEWPALPLAFLAYFHFLRSVRGKIHHAGKSLNLRVR